MGGVISNIFGFAGEMASGQPRQEEAEFNAQEAKRSAKQAGVAAQEALLQGEQEAGVARMRGAEMVARQQLAYSASGFDASTGTPSDVAAGTMLWTELDARIAKNNAIRRSLGYKEAEAKYTSQAERIYKNLEAEDAQSGLRAAGHFVGAFGSAIGMGAGG